MRVYGRVQNPLTKAKEWVVITTAPNGDNSQVYLTWLAQVFRLNYGESPFFGDWGIPAVASVQQQIAPDFYVAKTQRRFSQYFANISVARLPAPINAPTPQYQVTVLLKTGAVITLVVTLPGPPQVPS